MEILGVELNLLALIISIVLAFAVGAAWYTQILFGKTWLKLVGLSPKQQEQGMVRSMVVGFILIALMVFGYAMMLGWLALPVALVLQNDSAIVIAVFIAVVMWVFTFLPSNWLNDNYEGKSWKLTAINAVYQLVVLLIPAVVFAVIG